MSDLKTQNVAPDPSKVPETVSAPSPGSSYCPDCDGWDNPTSNPPIASAPVAHVPQGGLELIDQPNGVIDEHGYMTITGRVKNSSSKTYKYAQITFTVTNKEGEQVASALANINNLEAGQVWKFRAVSLAAGGVKYKLGSISGW